MWGGAQQCAVLGLLISMTATFIFNAQIASGCARGSHPAFDYICKYIKSETESFNLYQLENLDNDGHKFKTIH